MRPTIWVIMVLGCGLLFFQNCSDIEFQKANSDLVAKSGPHIEDEDSLPGEGEQQDEELPGDNSSDDLEEDIVDDGAESKDDNKRVEDGRGDKGDKGDQKRGVAKKAEFICILEGPGESLRLALDEGILTGDVSTPKTVCMSRTACEEIVDQAFVVKKASHRGFCPDKNPHVEALSDSEIQSLVDKI